MIEGILCVPQPWQGQILCVPSAPPLPLQAHANAPPPSADTCLCSTSLCRHMPMLHLPLQAHMPMLLPLACRNAEACTSICTTRAQCDNNSAAYMLPSKTRTQDFLCPLANGIHDVQGINDVHGINGVHGPSSVHWQMASMMPHACQLDMHAPCEPPPLCRRLAQPALQRAAAAHLGADQAAEP